MTAGHASRASLFSAVSVLSFAYSATQLGPARAVPSVQIPVVYYYSLRPFDECGWTCRSFSGSCFSWEYEWACSRNPGYEEGGEVLRFSPTDFAVLDLSLKILQNLTSDPDMYEKITQCVGNSINYPEVILYQEDVGQVPPEQAGDGCSSTSECFDRAKYDLAHAIWYAKSWPPISLVPWYDDPSNGDDSGFADAVAFVNAVQRQVRFVNEAGVPDNFDYPQLYQYWGDYVVFNINRAYIDLYVSGGAPCWNPQLSGPNKYQECDVNADISDFSSCLHCTARRYAGTLVHELLHLMGHQHHAYGASTATSYLHQTFIYTVGDCVQAWGDFDGTRNAGSQVSTSDYDDILDYSYSENTGTTVR